MDTKPVPNHTLIRQLEWRYATKQFDPTLKISQADWETLEQALVLSPSSCGLQPWKFFVIDSPEIRARLSAASRGQSQPLDASHLVVLTLKKDISTADVEHYIARAAEVRGVAPESLEPFKAMLLGAVNGATSDGSLNTWMSRQVYIALGNLLTSAAMLGIDACPMEGIEPAKYDEVLGLAAKGYTTMCVVALGFRAATDKYAAAPKVRYPREEVVEHI